MRHGGRAPFTSESVSASSPPLPKISISFVLATVGVPPVMAMAPLLMRMAPAALRLTVMVLLESVPPMTSSPVEAVNTAVFAAGGNPYGVSATTGPSNNAPPTEANLAHARYLGQRVTTIAAKLRG